MNITEELRFNRNRLVRENRCQRLLTAYKQHLADLDFKSAYYYAYQYPADSWTLSLNLSFETEPDAREAALVLAQRLGYDKPISKRISVDYTDRVRTNFQFQAPGIEVSTNGDGAPRTCEVVYDEVEVPAHTVRRARVVCPEVT